MKEWLRSNEKAVCRVLNVSLLVCMVLFGAEGFLGMGDVGRQHLLTALAVLGLLAGMNFMTARGRILCLAAVLIFLCIGVGAAGLEDSLAFLRSFFPWFMGGGAVPEEWRLGYGLLQTGIIVVICYLVQVLSERVHLLKIGLAVLIFAAMLLCLFMRWELDHFGVAFLLCYLAVTCAEGVQSRWEKARMEGGGKRAYMLWIMPFLALYLVFLAAMPVPEKPYDWLWAKNIYSQIRESLQTLTQNIKWGTREGFGMAFSGFSGDGTLRGDLQEEMQEVMTVQAEGDPGQDLYLTGSMYDTFDGRSWSQERQGGAGEVFWDTAQTLYAVRNYDQRYQKDYLREIRLEVRYEYFNTGYVFAPLKTWGLKEGTEGKGPDYACQGGSLRWEEQKGYGTEYSLRYFRLNIGQEEFDRFLEEAGRMYGGASQEGVAGAQEANESVLTALRRECLQRNGESFTLEGLEEYRQEMYRDYLGEVRLSEAMESYLEDVIGDAETPAEKLRAIERALSSLTYTLTPGELPDQVKDEGSFLDYFLLESRQGYCTYFATAFVLLARAAGIPARYVQGFCVPLAQEGVTYVYSDMAHAWPEAYLEGVGWIPFEPTPGYGARRYAPWGSARPSDGAPVSGDSACGGADADADLDPEEDVLGAGEDEAQDTDSEPAENTRDFWRLLGTAVPMILACCGILLAFDTAIGRYRYGRMSPEERLRREVINNLEVLSWLGLSREEGETLQELGERAEHLPGLSGDGDIRKYLGFIDDYEKVIYGGAQVEEGSMKEAAKARGRLLALLKEQRKWAYLYCRMRLYLGRYR